MLNRIYVALGAAVLAGYAWLAFTGWEFGGSQARPLPADVRHGGYRSFHFWHAGYRGGK